MGELARTMKRSTALNLGDVESEFRATVAAVLDRAQELRNAHSVRRSAAPGLATGAQRDQLAESGLVAPHLPAPWGVGATRGPAGDHQRGVRQPSRADQPSLGIAEWILPTILDAGTDLQRERFA